MLSRKMRETLRTALVFVLTYALVGSTVPTAAIAEELFQATPDASAKVLSTDAEPEGTASQGMQTGSSENPQPAVDAAVLASCAHLPENAGEEERVRAAYEYVRGLVCEAPADDAVAPVPEVGVAARDLLGKAAAESWSSARLLASMLSALDIANCEVTSAKKTWNMVRIDGAWYHVDAFAAAQDNAAPDTWFLVSDDVVRELDPSREQWSLADSDASLGDMASVPQATTSREQHDDPQAPSTEADTPAPPAAATEADTPAPPAAATEAQDRAAGERQDDVSDNSPTVDVPLDEVTALDDESFDRLVAQDQANGQAAEEEDVAVRSADEAPAAEGDGLLGWDEWYATAVREYGDNPSKEAYAELTLRYAAYRLGWLQENGVVYPDGANGGVFSNDYLEVALSDTGRFTIGTKEGNPNYTTDNNHKLLYGHASPGTSETRIVIDDSYSQLFSADSIIFGDGCATAVMSIPQYDIVVVQTLTLTRGGGVSYDDTVQIQYRVINGSSSQSHRVGIRIMLDTMIANNDSAPFKIAGIGNVTTCKTFTGSAIPASYQVYDNLDHPTTLATGYLRFAGERVPDKVQFCNWGGVRGSAWGYSVADGSTLGDSAVAITFDKTLIKAGQTTTVNTRYGVGVGSSIGLPTTQVPEDAVQVIVKDGSDDTLLADAQVELRRTPGPTVQLATETQTTDISGQAIFRGFTALPEAVGFTVSRNGYKTHAQAKTVSKGSVVTLYTAPSDVPLLSSVTMGSTDLLSDSVHFIENSNKQLEKAKATASSELGEVTIIATSDMDDCVFYLMEDEKAVLPPNETGVFKLDTLSTNAGVIVDKLHARANRYIKCVSKGGKSSIAYRIGIKVSMPSVKTETFFDKAQSAKITDLLPVGNSAIAKGGLAALFLGNTFKFGPKNENSRLKFEVKLDDTKLYVGLNVNSLEDEDLKKLKSDFKNQSASSAKWSKHVKGLEPVKMGAFETEWAIAGYGEGQIEHGSARVDLGVKFSVKGKYTHTANFFYVVPLYIKVGGEVGVAAEAKANIWGFREFDSGETYNSGPQLKIYSGTIKPSLSLFLEGGVGTSGIVTVGAEGKATLESNIDLVNKALSVYLTGSASLTASALCWSKSLPLASATVKIYDSEDGDGAVEGEGENLWQQLQETPFQLRDRSYLSASERPDGAALDDSTIAAYENSEPVVVSANGTLYRFRLNDDTSKQVSNASTLVYETYQNGWWSEPVTVLDDGTADYFFDVKTTGDTVYVAWQNSNTTFDDATVTPDDTADAAEIYLAVIRQGEVKKTVRITNNDELDTLPSVTVLNGQPYLAWLNTRNGLGELTEPNYVRCASVTNPTGSPAVRLLSAWDFGTRNVESIAAYAVAREPMATVILTDGDNFDEPASEVVSLHMSSGSQEKVEANPDAIVSASLDGEPKLFWAEGGNLYCASSMTETAQRVLDADSSSCTGANLSVFDYQGDTYAVWTAHESESEATKLYAVRYASGSWGQPYVLDDDLGLGSVSCVCGYEDANHDLAISYLSTSYNSDGTVAWSDLRVHTVQERPAVELGEMDVDASLAIPGKALPLSIPLTNVGNTKVDAVSVRVYSYDTDDDYTKTVSGLGLDVGQSTQLEIDDFVLDANLGDLTAYDSAYSYTVSVEPMADSARAATAEFEVGAVDLVVEQEAPVIVDNEECLPVRVSNRSGFAARNVHLRVLADSSDGLLICDRVYDVIPAAGSVVAHVNERDYGSSMRLYAYLTSDSLTRGSEQEYTELFVSDEVATLTNGVELTVSADQGGRVSAPANGTATYSSADKVDLEAVPEDGYVFDRWTASGNATVEDPYAARTTASFVSTGEGTGEVRASFVAEGSGEFDLSESLLTLVVGASEDVTATFADGVSRKLSWTTSDESVAGVTPGGTVVAVSAGQATITATSGTCERSCLVRVSDVPVESIRMVNQDVALSRIGETATLDTVISPATATEPLVWTSSDERVVTVDDQGSVTATGYGEATVTASSTHGGHISATARIEVSRTVTGISLSRSSVTLELSDANPAADLTASIEPVGAEEGQQVTWEVMPSNVASVRASGEHNERAHIVATAEGRALVIAHIGELSAYCNVQVEHHDIVRVSAKATSFESPHDYASNMSRYWVYTKTGAPAIALTFDTRTLLENRYDYLQVLDARGNVVRYFTGADAAGQSVVVQGATVKVLLHTDGSVNKWGFKVAIRVGATLSASNTKVAVGKAPTYTGKALLPNLTVTCNGTRLIKNVDYKITATNNTHVGSNKATYTVKGCGAFKGSLKGKFSIARATKNAITGLKTTYARTGSSSKATSFSLGARATIGKITYTSSNGKVKVNSSGKVTIAKGFVGAATITAKVAATSDYVGVTKKAAVTVRPPVTSVSKLAIAGKGKVKATWKRNTLAAGYEIQYCLSSKFTSGVKKIKIGKQATLSRTISGLKKGKTYYVRIRAYKKVSKTTYYSAWSSTRRIKVTK